MHLESNLTCRKVGQGQSRIIFCANLVGITSQCLIPSSKVISHLVIENKILKKVFLLYMGVVPILVMWPKQFAKILANLSKGVSIWNSTSIGQVVSEKTMFKYIDRLQYERPWMNVRGKSWPLELFLKPLSHKVFNILSKINDLGFNSIQKINFSKKSHLIAFGCKFYLYNK